MEGFSDVPAYLGFKSLMRCIEGLMMGFTERERERVSEQESVRGSVGESKAERVHVYLSLLC